MNPPIMNPAMTKNSKFLIHVVEANGKNPIVVEKETELTMIEYHRGKDSSSIPLVIDTQIRCEEGSKFHYVIVNQEKDLHIHQKIHVKQERNSHFHMTDIAMGTKASKSEICIDLHGENSITEFYGLLYPRNQQIAELDLNIHHHQANCRARCITRTVLDDAAKGSVQGKITVHPNAAKSLAHFEVKSLLLSEHAEIKTKPEFEIYHDDVSCTHGATVGILDQNALFYLRSRGIPEEIARALLIKAFLQPILSAISVPNLPDFMESLEVLMYE